MFRNPSIDGARPSALADDMQITKQSVNDLLGHVERRGYLVREADPADNRSPLIRLTTRGRELEAAVFAAAARAEQEAAELIGADRMRELRQTLFDLVALLDEDQKRQRVAP